MFKQKEETEGMGCLIGKGSLMEKVGQAKEYLQDQYFIGGIEQASAYMQDQYIRSGYRINFTRKRAVMKSLFMKHNETINVWTHLVGVCLVLGFILQVVFSGQVVPKVKHLALMASTSHPMQHLMDTA